MKIEKRSITAHYTSTQNVDKHWKNVKFNPIDGESNLRKNFQLKGGADGKGGALCQKISQFSEIRINFLREIWNSPVGDNDFAPPHEKSGPYFDSNTIYMKIRARSVGEFPSLCRGGGGSRFRNAMGRKTVVVHNGDGSIWLVFRAIKESIMKNFHHVLVMGMCELTRFRWVFCDRFFIFIYLRMT